jgi:hypothetical protein
MNSLLTGNFQGNPCGDRSARRSKPIQELRKTKEAGDHAVIYREFFYFEQGMGRR